MPRKLIWLLSLLTLILLAGCSAAASSGKATGDSDPWAFVPTHDTHTDHANIIQGPFDSGPEVTQKCLECHPDAAEQVMHTTHWTWEGDPVTVPWRDEPVTIGKKTQINNFCISAQGNEKKCTTCHTGYGWADDTYDFSNESGVDCLACHADAALYNKGEYGLPAETVDLTAAAQSVRAPTREECGKCHFDGGGGNGVKHGDLDESLYFPSENIDVHMGRLNFLCTDCHQTEDHEIKGKLLGDNITISPADQVSCQDCHQGTIHDDERINQHTDTVACQTCHVPAMALKDPTKTYWDWSTAGQDLPEDHYTYLKIKGSFEYEKDILPTYEWFNGNIAYRYLLGDTFDPSQPLNMVVPEGSIDDPSAKIFPFKLHVANQPYDTVNDILIPPRTAGEGGFWTTFDWPSALELGAQDVGLDYSGQYGFTETTMAYPTTHMVQPKENALQCNDCHSPDGRLDWQALGYPGDPMKWGGRDTSSADSGQPVAGASQP
ncbi:MAG: tetrathionate reductase family octaheme c-type cytochrome [Caldilineae bacterium]|nr:tetrathionate reductase family octaheme c-type cytochrome [Anaerolineae bacterium]MCB9152987.1 tetrathionate reductase family octaheme c-type cytochrome [Caldilineae bacterium]